jgi:hypothetical protein
MPRITESDVSNGAQAQELSLVTAEGLALQYPPKKSSVLFGIPGISPNWLQLVAATPPAGYPLVNGTGTIISWTAPNDGQMHRLMAIVEMDVTSTETGGQISLAHRLPDGTLYTPQLIPAAQAAGGHNMGFSMYFVQQGTTANLLQNSALTGGAATLWAEFWAL